MSLYESTITDTDRARDLRRMKAFAGSLLVLAALIYLLARRAEAGGAAHWVGFVRAAAEAGMVGGLADWFAVTALFRRPLGLPIPHTAIVPTRKDALGRSLGDFVGTHFLAEDVVRERVRQAGVAGRVGAWLAVPRNAARVVGEVAVLVRGALTVLRDEEVQDLLEQTVVRPLARLPIGPPLGRALHRIVTDGSHHPLVELVLREALAWLRANREQVMAVVVRQAPSWSPRLVDEIVAARVYYEVVRFVKEVGARTDHPARLAFDRYLARLADDLRHDPTTMAQADALKERLLERGDVREALGAMWTSVRKVLLDGIDDPDSDLRRRGTEAFVALGERLGDDPSLRAKADGWIEAAVAHVATTYRDELTTVITDTIERWDPDETTRRIELRVGRDLQFIRVNGTVVGALAGVAIHGAGLLVG